MTPEQREFIQKAINKQLQGDQRLLGQIIYDELCDMIESFSRIADALERIADTQDQLRQDILRQEE